MMLICASQCEQDAAKFLADAAKTTFDASSVAEVVAPTPILIAPIATKHNDQLGVVVARPPTPPQDM